MLPEVRTSLLAICGNASCSARVLNVDTNSLDILWDDDPSEIHGEFILRWVAGSALYLVKAERHDHAFTRSTVTITGDIQRIQRRESFRVPLTAPIALTGFELSTTGNVIDISEGGMSVLVKETPDLQPNDVLTCSFALGDKDFEASALVVRTMPLDRGSRIALSWVNPNRVMVDTIRKAVFDAQLRPGYRP